MNYFTRIAFCFSSIVFLTFSVGCSSVLSTTGGGGAEEQASLPIPENAITVTSPDAEGFVTITGLEGVSEANAEVVVEVSTPSASLLQRFDWKKLSTYMIPQAHAEVTCHDDIPLCEEITESSVNSSYSCRLISDADGGFTTRIPANIESAISISSFDESCTESPLLNNFDVPQDVFTVSYEVNTFSMNPDGSIISAGIPSPGASTEGENSLYYISLIEVDAEKHEIAEEQYSLEFNEGAGLPKSVHLLQSKEGDDFVAFETQLSFTISSLDTSSNVLTPSSLKVLSCSDPSITDSCTSFPLQDLKPITKIDFDCDEDGINENIVFFKKTGRFLMGEDVSHMLFVQNGFTNIQQANDEIFAFPLTILPEGITDVDTGDSYHIVEVIDVKKVDDNGSNKIVFLVKTDREAFPYALLFYSPENLNLCANDIHETNFNPFHLYFGTSAQEINFIYFISEDLEPSQMVISGDRTLASESLTDLLRIWLFDLENEIADVVVTGEGATGTLSFETKINLTDYVSEPLLSDKGFAQDFLVWNVMPTVDESSDITVGSRMQFGGLGMFSTDYSLDLENPAFSNFELTTNVFVFRPIGLKFFNYSGDLALWHIITFDIGLPGDDASTLFIREFPLE